MSSSEDSQMMALATSPTPRSKYTVFDLPLEVRMMIYRLVSPHDSIRITVGHYRMSLVKSSEPEPLKKVQQENIAISISRLSVNKAVRAECLALLFKSKQLHLIKSSETSASLSMIGSAINFMCHAGYGISRTIKYLTFRLSVEDHRHFSLGNFSEITMLLSRLPRLKGLCYNGLKDWKLDEQLQPCIDYDHLSYIAHVLQSGNQLTKVWMLRSRVDTKLLDIYFGARKPQSDTHQVVQVDVCSQWRTSAAKRAHNQVEDCRKQMESKERGLQTALRVMEDAIKKLEKAEELLQKSKDLLVEKEGLGARKVAECPMGLHGDVEETQKSTSQTSGKFA